MNDMEEEEDYLNPEDLMLLEDEDIDPDYEPDEEGNIIHDLYIIYTVR